MSKAILASSIAYAQGRGVHPADISEALEIGIGGDGSDWDSATIQELQGTAGIIDRLTARPLDRMGWWELIAVPVIKQQARINPLSFADSHVVPSIGSLVRMPDEIEDMDILVPHDPIHHFQVPCLAKDDTNDRFEVKIHYHAGLYFSCHARRLIVRPDGVMVTLTWGG